MWNTLPRAEAKGFVQIAGGAQSLPAGALPRPTRLVRRFLRFNGMEVKNQYVDLSVSARAHSSRRS